MVTIDLKFGVGNRNLTFTDEYKTLIQEGGQLLTKALATDEFRSKVHDYSWKHKRRRRYNSFNHTNISREKVYAMIISGNDKFAMESEDDGNVLGDKDIDIWITPYRYKSNVVGKTYRNTYRTWLNLSFWDKKLSKSRDNHYNIELVKIALAKHLVHEYCHNLGFKHKGNKKHRNNNVHSVPYAIGKIVHDILVSKLNNNQTKSRSSIDFRSDELFDYHCDD